MTPSAIIMPKNVARASRSDRQVRATIGDWVAWKPEMMPQAMVTKRHGKSGFFDWKPAKPAQSENISGFLKPATTSATEMAAEPTMSSAPKTG